MSIPPIRWVRAVCGAVVAEIGQIAAAFGWVAIYSHLIRPGQSLVQYQAHAQASGPWVSIIAGVPIFYAASRWIAGNAASALMLWGVFVLIDGGLLLAASAETTLPLGLIAASYATKLLACYAGGKAAGRRSAAV